MKVGGHIGGKNDERGRGLRSRNSTNSVDFEQSKFK